jgi:hypothetical protein
MYRRNNQPAVWTKYNDKIETSDGGAVRFTVGQTVNGQDVKVMVPSKFLEGLSAIILELTEQDMDNLSKSVIKAKELQKVKAEIAKHQEKAQKLLQASIDALIATGMDETSARQTLGLSPKAA